MDALALPDAPTLTLAEGLILLSVWKPVVLLIPFVAWAWLVSVVFDKHCARFFLPRNPWNIFHLSMGLLAFLVAIALPVEGHAGFFVSLGVVLVILAADVIIFVTSVNKDDRVPEAGRLGLDFSKYKEAQAAKAAAKKAGKVELIIKAPDKSVLPVPAADTPEFNTRVASETAYMQGIDARASQIELLPGGKDASYVLRSLVDGQPIVHRSMPPQEASQIMAFWKAAAKLDLAENRKHQTADIHVERGADRRKLRVSTIGTQGGPKLTLLIDPEAQVRRKFEQLGLLESQATQFKELTSTLQGVVLLGALPDGGRTTLLYSTVKLHDAYTQNVQTIEIDTQDILEGAKQNKFDPQAEGAEFSTTLRSILRRDPQVVGVAEVPDSNTAKEIVKADSDRVRVYASIPADSAMTAVVKWVKLVGDQEQASKQLKGVVAMRLLRKVCTNCRVAYQPPPDMLKKLNLPADKVQQLVKKGGQVLIKNKPEVCPVCQGTGYLGQEGVFEVFVFDDACREAIRSGNINALRAELRKKQFPTIAQAAMQKLVTLTTTVDEVIRITAEAAPPAAQPAPAAPKPA
jgi:type II secretory ATPase GspE/PulE/Tfp pilus assembly ATPase PilB-like protein